ncbi:MAG: hypothetical protein NVV59_03735 [Chitinophagaceae bacterium]|nr:hypothetical protein [Chitinophagaceae bacterium]
MPLFENTVPLLCEKRSPPVDLPVVHLNSANGRKNNKNAKTDVTEEGIFVPKTPRGGAVGTTGGGVLMGSMFGYFQ